MLSDVLRVAVAQGLLLLPDRGVVGLARLDGDVLRYEAGGPPQAVARAVLRVLASQKKIVHKRTIVP